MRRLELTQPLVAELAELLESGLGVGDVCRHVGISTSQFKRWYKIGKAKFYGDRVSDTDVFVDFFMEVGRAKAEGRKQLIETIRVHASKDWKAAAYLLERIERTEQQSVAGENSVMVQQRAIDAAKRILETEVTK